MAQQISGMVVPVQRTGYLSGTACSIPTPESKHFQRCPQTADKAAVHGPVDDVGHGPMCEEHARAQVVKCLKRTCTRLIYRDGQYVVVPTFA